MDKRTKLQLNQSRSYATVIHQVARDVFDSGKPADRILSARFRGSKKFGSRDRRMIAETLFSVMRWWGWLQNLAKAPDKIFKEDGDRHPDWYRILFAAHALDNGDLNPIGMRWKEQAKITTFVPDLAAGSLTDRARNLGKGLRCKRPNWIELIPHWLRNEVPLPKEDFQKLVETLQQRPPLWIRLQTKDKKRLLDELRREKLTPKASEHLPDAVSLGQARVNVYNLKSFQRGQFEIQDLASQVIGMMTRAKPGQRWWDVCAGAGGKSLQLSAMMQNKGTIVATEIRDYKLVDLKKRARRSRCSNISPKGWDGKKLPVNKPNFDGVLVDAPCTCSGTWRRNPDARWTTTAAEAAEIAELQLEILARAAGAVKVGGILVYATCSLCERENEGVVTSFLTTHPEFGLSPIKHPITGVETPGMIRVWPYEADCDATFVARLQRRS